MKRKILLYIIGMALSTLWFIALGAILVQGYEFETKPGDPPRLLTYAFLGAIHVGFLYALFCASSFSKWLSDQKFESG